MARLQWNHGLPLVLALGLTVALSACGNGDAAGAGAAAGGGGPPGGMPPLPVEAITLKPQKLEAGLQTVGSLRADESVVVRPEVGGRIVRINFTEGASVNAGQPLFVLDGSVQQAALNEQLANVENSRRAAERTHQLLGDKLIAQSDYDRARAAYGVDQARVASARTALAKMTMRAPFSGRIGLRQVSVGDFVTVGQDLVTLVRLDPIEVDFSVPEGALPQLENGQRIAITVDAFPADEFVGKVTAIDPVVDPNSRSAKLRAQIPNPDGRLRPGQFAQLQLDTGANSVDAVMVPEQALMQEGSQRFVWTVVAGKAKKVIVKTGVRVPGAFQVIDGVKAGDQVITAGQNKPMMSDGLPVQVLPGEGAAEASPAAANPAAAKPASAKAAEPKPADPKSAEPAPAEAK
ncbi:efflux RND transporter periplasmic adaptor subunit [Agrilutibacter solisilvae]|uniref:Efflux RND transporter periplasmic adaptor subunit n=1 Tax=Agrilutibacter solisilvae TaxID=2763317 RepID=A0A975ASX6_9GAMM|nr:efflux RND transporter periplasmic adaptor subunit [Lysobacter solisilvae]QSX79429.1 efflux RND transporter periplasmic adaptor subunit [Lysobacter solisilvae]